ncbi:MAG: diacylglycerol kinase [Burkholderiales bacterium]|jgi:diacylglycerol kinase (ATP)|nr:diacylglycerol kinase [Burkholderiales bacterium]
MKRLFSALIFSLQGIIAAFRDEAAFRQLVVLAVIGIGAAWLLPLSALAKITLTFAHLFTLIVELLNTAIEAAIDRISEERHPLSKKAKDCGSAAQLIALITLGGLWLVALMSWI